MPRLRVRVPLSPPILSRSPKLDVHVERAQRTHTGEFYHLCDGDLEFEPLIQALLAWEGVYNTLCPHHLLGGLTPAEYLHHYHPDLLATAVSHMY